MCIRVHILGILMCLTCINLYAGNNTQFFDNGVPNFQLPTFLEQKNTHDSPLHVGENSSSALGLPGSDDDCGLTPCCIGQKMHHQNSTESPLTPSLGRFTQSPSLTLDEDLPPPDFSLPPTSAPLKADDSSSALGLSGSDHDCGLTPCCIGQKMDHANSTESPSTSSSCHFSPPPSLTVFQKSSSTSTPPINESSQKKTTMQPRKNIYARRFAQLKFNEASQREEITLEEVRAWKQMITHEESEENFMKKTEESPEERAWNEIIKKSEIKRSIIIPRNFNPIQKFVEGQKVLTVEEKKRKENILHMNFRSN